MKPRGVRHVGDCPCKHPPTFADTGVAYTVDLCDNCLCLYSYGECSWEQTWGDQYAGGIDRCSHDALPGVDRCESHGGAGPAENALLRRRLELAGKAYDKLMLLLVGDSSFNPGLVGYLVMYEAKVNELQAKLDVALATGAIAEPTLIYGEKKRGPMEPGST